MTGRKKWLQFEDEIVVYLAERIEEWRQRDPRPPAQIYFTAGLEREIARMLEHERAAVLQSAAQAAGSVYEEHFRGNPLVKTLDTPRSVLDAAVRLIQALHRQ